MKTLFAGLLFLNLFVAFHSQADQARYETVTIVSTITGTNFYNYDISATNLISIAEGEVGELICVEGSGDGSVVKNSIEVRARPATTFNFVPSSQPHTGGTTVAGPASFKLWYFSTGSLPQASNAKALMTVKITPLTYSPQKSVTVAPGMGNVQIELESSTNLLTWAASTNGVYNDDLRFFRVKLTKLNP